MVLAKADDDIAADEPEQPIGNKGTLVSDKPLGQDVDDQKENEFSKGTTGTLILIYNRIYLKF